MSRLRVPENGQRISVECVIFVIKIIFNAHFLANWLYTSVPYLL